MVNRYFNDRSVLIALMTLIQVYQVISKVETGDLKPNE